MAKPSPSPKKAQVSGPPVQGKAKGVPKAAMPRGGGMKGGGKKGC